MKITLLSSGYLAARSKCFWINCRHCGYKDNILYDIDGSEYCYSCAINYWDIHHFICETCGFTFENMYVSKNENEYGVCKPCREIFPVEFLRVRGQLSRTRKLGLKSNLTLGQWVDTLKEYKFSCAYCGGGFEQLDHVLPVSLGGGTTKDNCVPSCKKCNRKKHNSTSWIPV